jgi:hypothetical protein
MIAREVTFVLNVNDLVLQVADLLIPVVAAEIERRVGLHELAYHQPEPTPLGRPLLRLVSLDDLPEMRDEDVAFFEDQAT